MAGEVQLGQGDQAGGGPGLGPPPGPDENIAGQMLGPVISFFVVALSLASLRLYTRLTRRQGIDFRFSFSWDDITLLLALIFTIIHFGFLMAAVPYGIGRHASYVPREDFMEAVRLLLFTQLPWGWSVAFAKISIACLLLRLKSATSEGLWPWKAPLYFLIFVQIASAFTTNIVQLTQCRPIRAIWNPTLPGAVCHDPKISHMAIYITSALAIMSDIFLATAPISFLKNVRRSIRERAILIFLMGLALFTAITTIFKIPMVEPYGKFGDALWDTTGIIKWSTIEACMGIIAASVPCLKSPFEGFLRRVGVLKSTTSEASAHGTGSIGSGNSRNRNMHSDVMGNRGGHHHRHDSYTHGHSHPHRHHHSHHHGQEDLENGLARAHTHPHTHTSTKHDRKSYTLSNILVPTVPISGGHFLSPKTTPDVVLQMAHDAASSEQSILDHTQK